jgi:hypothetical protein
MKLTDEESNTLKLGIVTFTFMLFLGFLLFFAAALTGCSSQSISANTAEDQEAEIFMLRCKVANQKAIIEAYEDVLHEVWLDKPAYVEDALAEGDAFIHLDEIVGENDVFRFHSKKDSIRYMNNWYGGESSW